MVLRLLVVAAGVLIGFIFLVLITSGCFENRQSVTFGPAEGAECGEPGSPVTVPANGAPVTTDWTDESCNAITFTATASLD